MYLDLLSPGYSSGVPGLIDLAMASLLSQAELPSLAVPSIFGVEFDALVWQPDENQDWLGGYVFLNTDNIEPFVVPSCSASILAAMVVAPQSISTLRRCLAVARMTSPQVVKEVAQQHQLPVNG